MDKQPAFILGSSGSTGKAKGVKLSHAHVLDKFYIDHLTSDDVHLVISPFSWWSGSAPVIFGTLAGCTRVITREIFSPEFILLLISKHKVTSVISSPYQMALTLKCPEMQSTDLRSLSKYLTGGAYLPNDHRNEMNSKLPNGTVCTIYGMTEVGGILTLNDDPDNPETVGFLAPNTEGSIIDDDGIFQGPGKSGEILLRLNFTFLGYAGNFQSENMSMIIDGDNWIHSGDIGHFDENGYLYVTGRKRDVLMYFSERISASDIEEVIVKHFGIASVCVVGIPDKTTSCDQIAAVIVRPKDKKFTEEDVYNIVAGKKITSS